MNRFAAVAALLASGLGVTAGRCLLLVPGRRWIVRAVGERGLRHAVGARRWRGRQHGVARSGAAHPRSASYGRRPRDHYAFSVGGGEVLSLNSEAPHDAASAQVGWLRVQLRAPGACRIALWHRPRFSAGPHGDATDTAPLWNALKGHAAIVLNGHDHDLQQLRPNQGLTEIVDGAGGDSQYGLKHDCGWSTATTPTLPPRGSPSAERGPLGHSSPQTGTLHSDQLAEWSALVRVLRSTEPELWS